jgi:hypothetical protein
MADFEDAIKDMKRKTSESSPSRLGIG